MFGTFEFESVSVEEAAMAIAPPQPKTVEPQRRGAEPPASLDDATVRWLQSLPQDLAPWELARAFPRIANTLCELWRRPSRCDPYFKDLILNERHWRAGFPAAVMKELGLLGAHYAEMYPARVQKWEQAPHRG